MKIPFCKYHGTGNDFILIDNRENKFPNQEKVIRDLCNRKFGIGADGLILIQSHDVYNFEMIYYNSDGKEGSMCGNGGRCSAHFAKQLGIYSDHAEFIAIDGIHEAKIEEDVVKISMNPVDTVQIINSIFLIDTGSPHAVLFVENLESMDVISEGSSLRYDKNLSMNGVNVNFVKIIDKNIIQCRTYERGVEDETLSCGTGVIASAIASYINLGSNVNPSEYTIETKGGKLQVSFNSLSSENFEDISLKGEAKKVFKGEVNI